MIGIRRILIVIMVLITMTACMEDPIRDTGRPSGAPVLWLYEAAAEDASATLYRKIGDESPVMVAEGIIPGSHRMHDDRVLILDREFRLYYAEDDLKPYLLFDNIAPYSYGFVDEGRKVFAVSRDGRFILRTFGMDDQVLAERIQRVVPLRNRLLAATDTGRVYAYDYYGREQVAAERAIYMAALPPDDIYAVIITQDAAIVTDGVEQLYAWENAGTLAMPSISADGSSLLYVDRYEEMLGAGELILRTRATDERTLLAEGVDHYEWDEMRSLVWYTAEGKLIRHELMTGDRRVIAEDVRTFTSSETNGRVAAVVTGGTLSLYDSDGAQLVAEPLVERVQPHIVWHGDGLIYLTEDGVTGYLDEDGAASLGEYNHWLHDGEQLIGIQEDAVISLDRSLRRSILLADSRPYQHVYHDERLLAESSLRVADLAGRWTMADGRQLFIRATGKAKGTLTFGGAEPIPFYVLIAAQDHLMLLLASRPEEDVYLRLASDESLHLTIGENESYMYVRSASPSD